MSTRILVESYTFDPKTVTLDEQNHVIKNVRVLGSESRNRYVPGSEGTQYTDPAMQKALPLYENVTVFADHPSRSNASAERSAMDAVGKIRNAKHLPGEIRGDLHYRPSSPVAQALVEDIKLGLGLYSLSHNAASDKERFDREKKKLLIESIAFVRSVDVVTRGATNRNLAESEMTNEPKTITFRSLLESDKKRFSKGRQSWLTRLMEMDGMDGAMASESTEATDPDEALKGGFKSAVLAVVSQSLDGDMPAADALKKIKELLTTHEKLNGDEDPAEPDGDEGDGGDEPKMESMKSELANLKAREKVRDLCESQKFIPSKTQLKALTLLESESERKELIGSWKGSTEGTGTGTGTAAKAKSVPAGFRNVQESQQQQTSGQPLKASDALNKLRS